MRLAAVAALISITLGNATSLLSELHHEHAGDEHDDHDCPICQQFLSAAKYVVAPPEEVSYTRETAWHDAQLPPVALHSQFAPLAIQPRGPPTVLASHT